MEEIKISSVDTENVEKDDSFETAYAFFVKLNKSPDSAWESLFENYWKNMLYSMKRSAIVGGDNIRLVYGKDDPLQSLIDFLNQVISHTNKAYQSHIEEQERIKLREEAKRKNIEETREGIKDKLKGLKF